jgi:hypothetical protein
LIEHRATSGFWEHYHGLPPHIRSSADKLFSLLKGNPQHASLQFKKIGDRQGGEVLPRPRDAELSGTCG